MGAWGTGIFDNDSAADWLWEYEDGGVDAVASALMEVSETPGDDYVEVDMGAWALAAAEVVAAAHGHPPEVVPEVQSSITKHSDAVRGQADLPRLALKAIDRVMAENSETLELWQEAGGDGEAAFRAAVEDLKSRLQGIAQ